MNTSRNKSHTLLTWLRVQLPACMFYAGLPFVLSAHAEPSVTDITALAKENLDKHQEIAATFQGTMTVTTVEEPSGTVLRKKRWLMRQLGPERSSEVITEMGPDSSTEYASVRNESYLFELERVSPRAQWAIKGFYERPPGAVPLSEEVAQDPRYRHSIKVPATGLRLYSKYLFDLLNEPGFALTSVDDRDEGIVRLTFVYKGELPNFPLTRGWVDVDPEHFFVIREYESEAKWPEGSGTIHSRCEYSIEPDGFPRITHAVRTESVLIHGKLSQTDDVIDFDLSRTIPVSKSDFTLSAFGLPEPPGPGRSFLPTSVFFWTTALLLVGLFSLMAAARLNRR